jgi:hypothetical protein
VTKRHLKPKTGVFPRVEVRPALDINEPNEIVVVLEFRVEDDEGNLHDIGVVMTADDWKFMARDILTKVYQLQAEHKIKTKPEVPPVGTPRLWRPPTGGANGETDNH